jgi:hypothetical protein
MSARRGQTCHAAVIRTVCTDVCASAEIPALQPCEEGFLRSFRQQMRRFYVLLKTKPILPVYIIGLDLNLNRSLPYSCLLLIRSVASESQWELALHSDLRASQWGLISCLPYPSSFLHNPKFRQTDCSASHLLSCWFHAWLLLRP